MPGKTNTEKIEELADRVGEHIPVAAYRFETIKKEIEELKLRLLKSEDAMIALLQRTAAQDERIKALEKGTDRRWQFAALATSAIAILVSIIVAFVKK